MDVTVKWKEKMIFEASARGLSTPMDANSPIGSDTALTPKELLLAGLCGCTAMDVAAMMKKHRQPVGSFDVVAQAEVSKGSYPVVFTQVHLVYSMTGEVEEEKVLEAVVLSKTKYCGVSAMLAKAFPITYEVQINGKTVKDSREA